MGYYLEMRRTSWNRPSTVYYAAVVYDGRGQRPSDVDTHKLLGFIIVNASGNVKKGQQVTPNHFDPYYEKMRREIDPKVTWQMMEKMFDKTKRREKKQKMLFETGAALVK